MSEPPKKRRKLRPKSTEDFIQRIPQMAYRKHPFHSTWLCTRQARRFMAWKAENKPNEYVTKTPTGVLCWNRNPNQQEEKNNDASGSPTSSMEQIERSPNPNFGMPPVPMYLPPVPSQIFGIPTVPIVPIQLPPLLEPSQQPTQKGKEKPKPKPQKKGSKKYNAFQWKLKNKHKHKIKQ